MTEASEPASDGGGEPFPMLVARVAVEVGLAHLDRPFDYSVPETLADDVAVGCRVTVTFAGRRVGGYVLGLVRSADHGPSEHGARLRPLGRVVSSEPVLSPPIARLARTVADRYAGTLADVLRLAVPPRHARVEREPPPVDADPGGMPAPGAAGPAAWHRAARGAELLRALEQGASPRTTWTALPADDWPAALAAAAACTVRGGRGAVLCLPDRRDVARVDAALTACLGVGRHVVLGTGGGPAARYRAFLSVLRGRVPVVVGTRAAAFAPVRDPGLFVVWDDGDDLLAEPRAPYPHAREVLTLRAHQHGAGLILAGHARTAETQQLVESGWLASVAAERGVVRRTWPRVQVAGGLAARGDGDPAARAARLPPDVFAAVRAGLAAGPVLLQVPRTGYRTRLSCQRCRTAARCPGCQGPLGQPAPDRAPACCWCGRTESEWRCGNCGDQRLRASVVGEERTAEELGRAFPGVLVRRSTGQTPLSAVPGGPALVVATPGAEPAADGGYAAAVLLDVGLALARPDLRAAEESLRRWLAVTALVRSATDGGTVVVVGDPGIEAVQALVRADPAGFAERELAQRRAARLPPATRLATIEGPRRAVEPLLERRTVAEITGSGWPEPAEVLGPVDLGDGRARLVVRVPWRQGHALARTLATLQSTRSAHKAEPLRVEVDPATLA